MKALNQDHDAQLRYQTCFQGHPIFPLLSQEPFFRATFSEMQRSHDD